MTELNHELIERAAIMSGVRERLIDLTPVTTSATLNAIAARTPTTHHQEAS